MLNLEEIMLLPFCHVDGKPTMSQTFIESMYYQTEKDYPGVVFYDGKINSAKEFFDHVTSRNALYFVIMYKTKPVAHIWFNRFDSTHAHGHWCWFKREDLSYEDKVTSGKWMMSQIYKIMSHSVLVGHIPTLNARAIKFAKEVGMTEIGVIPDLLWSEYLQAPIDGTVLYFQRKDVSDEDLYEDQDRHRDAGDTGE